MGVRNETDRQLIVAWDGDLGTPWRLDQVERELRDRGYDTREPEGFKVFLPIPLSDMRSPVAKRLFRRRIYASFSRMK